MPAPFASAGSLLPSADTRVCVLESWSWSRRTGEPTFRLRANQRGEEPGPIKTFLIGGPKEFLDLDPRIEFRLSRIETPQNPGLPVECLYLFTANTIGQPIH